MNATVEYKGQEVTFYDLIEDKPNIDRFVINKTLFDRPDHQFEQLLNDLDHGSVVYDIGGYIGSFAIPFALEGMCVHVFEGFPGNYERLKKNCAQYPNITVHNIAVSNENRKTTTKFNNCTGMDQPPVGVEYWRLDDYIKEKGIPSPDLVKVDIEGMETVALFGMDNLLRNIRPNWQIGYHIGLEDKYEDYPGFVKPEDGGFDFSTFEKLKYNVTQENGLLPFSRFAEYYCVPNENG